MRPLVEAWDVSISSCLPLYEILQRQENEKEEVNMPETDSSGRPANLWPWATLQRYRIGWGECGPTLGNHYERAAPWSVVPLMTWRADAVSPVLARAIRLPRRKWIEDNVRFTLEESGEILEKDDKENMGYNSFPFKSKNLRAANDGQISNHGSLWKWCEYSVNGIILNLP